MMYVLTVNNPCAPTCTERVIGPFRTRHLAVMHRRRVAKDLADELELELDATYRLVRVWPCTAPGQTPSDLTNMGLDEVFDLLEDLAGHANPDVVRAFVADLLWTD